MQLEKVAEMTIQVGETMEMAVEDFFAMAENEEGIYEIETPQGFVEIGDLYRKRNKECHMLRTADGGELAASDDHWVETTEGWQDLGKLDVNHTSVLTKNGIKEVVARESLGIHDTFDFEVSSAEHKYYANGIVSHNTGKTTLGRLICRYLPDHSVIWITSEMIQENENRIDSMKVLYRFAEYMSPVVVFLEDMDLYADDRTTHSDNARLGSLMNILDGVNWVKNAVTVATTNRLNLIEKALCNRPGRFDRVVEIGDLDADNRKRMLSNRIGKRYTITEELLNILVEQTSTWSGAEIEEFVHTIGLYREEHGIKTKALDKTLLDGAMAMVKEYVISIRRNAEKKDTQATE